MKRTCDGCRALDLYGCDLGYKTEKTHRQSPWYWTLAPLENCPKPRTYQQLLELQSKLTEGK